MAWLPSATIIVYVISMGTDLQSQREDPSKLDPMTEPGGLRAQ